MLLYAWGITDFMDQLSLPGFELLGKIGQGGMATVWKARQLSLDRLVAIKVLSPRLASDPADVERFHAECRSAAMLKHPGIVQVYDAMVHKGLYCLIMEYVAGESLGSRIRRKKRMTEDEVLFVLEHVAQALAYAWKTTGLIHCDIKPDNILIDSDGSIKITDLGLATTLGGMSLITQTEEIMGTPQYMSPEQISGAPPLDTRTDIYSMGATVYQMLTGAMLFEGAADDAVLDLQLKGHVPDILDAVPGLSSRMAWMTEKMLSRKRENRHADWSAVTADVERLMRHGFPAPPFPAPGASVMSRSKRRQKPHNTPPPQTASVLPSPASASETFIRILLFLLVVAALAATTFFLLKSRPPAPASPPPAPVIRSAPAPIIPAAPAVSESERRYADMFEFARDWCQKNPQRYQEALDQFDRVARETKGSKYALMAMEATRSVKQARETAIGELMGRLKTAADALGEQRKYEDAALLYDRYTGLLNSETHRKRAEAAKAWRDLAAHEQSALQTRDRDARLALGALLDESASLLVQGKLPESIAALAAAGSREELLPLMGELTPALELARKAAAMDQKILDSFARQAGQEVTVQLLSGPKTLIIGEVGGGIVHGDQKVSVGEGVAAASVKIRFSLEDVTLRERIQRMGADTEPDVALLKGCLAARNRSFSDARAYLTRIPGDFGVRLLAALERREAESQAAPAAPEAAAAKADPALPDTRPPAGAGESLSAIAFSTALAEANSGLTADDIQCEENSQQQVLKATVRSRYLQNLEPFKKIAASLEELTIPQNQAANTAPLAALTRLLRLDLSESAISDLSPLKDLKLNALILNATRVKDLTPLRNVPLRELEIANTRVYNFDPLRGIPLTRLNVANTQFSDMSAIRDMPLTDLNISGTKVFDFLTLRRFQLVAFQAYDTPFKDTSLLADMPILDLNLANSKVSELTPLRRLPLRSLTLSDTMVKDLSPLRDTKLVQLRVDNCKIKDLSALNGLPLTSLAINGTLVDDLAPLRGMALVELEAANTSVSDLGPLEGMPLTRVVITNVRVNSLRPLSRSPLIELHCEGTKPESLQVLRNVPLEVLYCDLRPGQMGFGLTQSFPHLRDLNGSPPFHRNPN